MRGHETKGRVGGGGGIAHISSKACPEHTISVECQHFLDYDLFLDTTHTTCSKLAAAENDAQHIVFFKAQ